MRTLIHTRMYSGKYNKNINIPSFRWSWQDTVLNRMQISLSKLSSDPISYIFQENHTFVKKRLIDSGNIKLRLSVSSGLCVISFRAAIRVIPCLQNTTSGVSDCTFVQTFGYSKHMFNRKASIAVTCEAYESFEINEAVIQAYTQQLPKWQTLHAPELERLIQSAFRKNIGMCVFNTMRWLELISTKVTWKCNLYFLAASHASWREVIQQTCDNTNHFKLRYNLFAGPELIPVQEQHGEKFKVLIPLHWFHIKRYNEQYITSYMYILDCVNPLIYYVIVKLLQTKLY